MGGKVLHDDHDICKVFESTFSRIGSNEKWKLKSGRMVEDVMFAYGVELKNESLVHSWILDLSDSRLQDIFTKEEWDEIKTQNKPKTPKIPKELARHMASYSKADVRNLRKKFYNLGLVQI